MRKIVLTSFPRSGHHLLVDRLRAYFGDELVYRDPYVDLDLEGATLLKSHDFVLDDDPRSENRIVLLRDDGLAAVQSWFDFDVKHGGLVDSAASWKTFLTIKSSFYRRWREKWVPEHWTRSGRHLSAVNPVFFYEELVRFPVATTYSAVRFILQERPQFDRLFDAVRSVSRDESRDGHFFETHTLRDTSTFRHQ